MFEEKDFDRVSCSGEERRSLLPLASKMRELAECSSSEGLFALGKYMDGTDTDLANAIQELLSDERKIPFSDRLRTLTLDGKPHGAALLRRMMIAEGMSGIDAGIKPGVLEQMVRAYLGADLFFETKKWELLC